MKHILPPFEIISGLLVSIICLNSAVAQIPAFPGAVGPGRFATGGRGSDTVIAVTNRNDSGPGSFRSALTAQGARFVIFKTGGVITLESPIIVTEDSLTIFGETAPGGGIFVTGDYIQFQAPNLIISGLRLRPGDATGGSHSDPVNRDGVFFNHAADNWIMSHCSIGWGQDVGGISIWTSMQNFPGSENWTVQDCMVSEPLDDNAHPKGPHSDAFNIARARNGLVYNVILGHSNARNIQVQGPSVLGASVEIRNFLLYNWESAAIEAEGTSQLWVSNSRFIPGLDKGEDTNAVTIEGLTAGSKVYLSHIIAPARTSDSGDNWVVTSNPSNRVHEASYEPFAGSTLRERYVLDDLRDHLFQTAGAILPRRDPVDSAFIQDVRNGTGRIKNVMGPVPKQIRWPMGFFVVSTLNDTQIVYIDPTKSVTLDRYKLDTLHITSGSGSGQRKKISTNTAANLTTGEVTVTVASPFSTLPNTSSAFDIILTYSDATRATRSVPSLATGSAPADSDSDHIPDAIETLIGTNPNSGTGNEGALGDKDGDGYLNIEEWVILLYDFQKERLQKR
jgi:hypothetical protein